MDEVVNSLKIVPAVEYREPEKVWVLPVVYGNKIVGHLKIFYDGLYVVPDYKSSEEMLRFIK